MITINRTANAILATNNLTKILSQAMIAANDDCFQRLDILGTHVLNLFFLMFLLLLRDLLSPVGP